MSSAPLTPATSAPPATKTGAAEAAKLPENPSNELGKDDFLKLMVAQLQAQNPLEPTSDTEYVGELAQFSQLEQTTNLAASSGELSSSQKVAQAVALIGHTVSYLEEPGATTVKGKVESVEITSSGPTLTIEGVGGVNPASVSEVS
jgi:flagellar basal-body rod modification protein FlgD